jgi:hypothetical protein
MSSFWKFFNSDEGEGQPADAKDNVQPEGDTVKKRTSGAPKGSPAATKGAGASAPPPPVGSFTPTGPQLPGVIIEPTPGRRSQAPSAETNMRYGIDDAIKLMRSLPVEENVDLVVRVMKTTLESLKVKVGDIIEDAIRRQDTLAKKVADYRAQIAAFEREIEARKHEIHRLEEELGETTRVKERLQAAENMSITPNPSVAHRGAPFPAPRKPELPKRAVSSMPPSKGELPPVILAQSEPELIPASEKELPKKDVYKDDD